MSIDQYLGSENTGDFSELENIRPEDQQNLEYVLDFLDEYAWHHGEGPIWLTGSAQHDPGYSDIDIVIERGVTEDDFPTVRDHELVYDMLSGLDEFDLENGESAQDKLIKSDNVDVREYLQFKPAKNRYKFEIGCTEFDLNFNGYPHDDDGIQLSSFYGGINL